LRSIVPDQTPSGAAVEGKTHGDHAENRSQSPEHGQPSPRPLSFGLELGIFKLRGAHAGRTMSFGRVTLSSATDNKPVAMVSSAFAML
jgi:hypothetical protein